MTTIAFSGKQGWQRMRPTDDAQLAAAVRQHVLTAAGQTSLTGDRRDKLLLAQVKNRWPTAVDTFGADAIGGLLHRPPDGCSWCPLKPMPTPTVALRKLLGSRCSDCQVRVDAQAVAERESEHVDAVVAAGLKPIAAGRLRTPEEIDSYRRRLDALHAAKLPPRPATRTPVPSYYQPGRRR